MPHGNENTAVKDWLLPTVTAYPVGSRVSCDPAPTDTDEDWLCLCDENYTKKIEGMGFARDGNPKYQFKDSTFVSYRRGDINLITTEDERFFKLFLTATELATRFNLQKKDDRVALFQSILYGTEAEGLGITKGWIIVQQEIAKAETARKRGDDFGSW